MMMISLTSRYVRESRLGLKAAGQDIHVFFLQPSVDTKLARQVGGCYPITVGSCANVPLSVRWVLPNLLPIWHEKMISAQGE
jgi:hypothetical protein